MRSVYEAENSLDAHMILGLLEQQRIPGKVEGEYLQGAVGGIQTMGLVRVLVDEADYGEAKRIIEEWESTQPVLDSHKPEIQSFGGLLILFVGVLIGGLIMYLLMKGIS